MRANISGRDPHYKDDEGSEKVADAKLDLPPDLPNGLMPVLLKNVGATTLSPTVSYVAATPQKTAPSSTIDCVDET